MNTALLAKDDSASAESAAELVVRPSTCRLLDDQGSEQVHFDRTTVKSLLTAGNFFWLDLDNPAEDDFAILRDVFKFHSPSRTRNSSISDRKSTGMTTSSSSSSTVLDPMTTGWSKCIAFTRTASSSQFIARLVRSWRRSAGAMQSANERWNNHHCCCTAWSMA
jgi:hypothetical protein